MNLVSRYKTLQAFVLGIILLNTHFNALEACTGIKLIAKDSSIVHGRTLEFGVPVETSIVIVPRNYEFKSTTPSGPGLSYTTRYATVGAIAYNNLNVMDGMNEKGLAVGTFYFPGYAKYAASTSENQSKALSPLDFPNWIVTQFATIEELKSALPSVVIAPTVSKEWGNEAPPFHYIVYDKTGESLVIEPIDGKLVTYENKLGSFSNSPTFDWHMTNLRNYIDLTAFNAKPITLRDVELAPFGEGSGMVGMPGDFTPPSRFVRATIFSVAAIPAVNASEAVLQAFHILNQFDIPVGAARQVHAGVTYTDRTMMTAVKNPQSLKYYFKTYEDQSIRVVDLTKFDLNAKAIKQLSTTGTEKIVDVSSALK